MTKKEKEYIQRWMYNEWGRAEVDYGEKLYFFSKHDNNTAIEQLNESFYKKEFCCRFMSNLNELLKLSMFDDSTTYNNRSAQYLNSISLSSQQDDLIYAFILGIVHSQKFSLGGLENE